MANGAKQWSNDKLSSLGRTCAGFMHSPACTKKPPSSRSCWMKAVTRGHHASRKITPVCWRGTQGGMLYPTASLQMEVSHPAGSPADGSSPSPFQQFPLPSCPASCGIPSCSRCWSDFQTCDPVDLPCLSISSSLCLCEQQSAAHSSSCASGHPECLRGQLGTFPLPVGCQLLWAARNIQETA